MMRSNENGEDKSSLLPIVEINVLTWDHLWSVSEYLSNKKNRKSKQDRVENSPFSWSVDNICDPGGGDTDFVNGCLTIEGVLLRTEGVSDCEFSSTPAIFSHETTTGRWSLISAANASFIDEPTMVE